MSFKCTPEVFAELVERPGIIPAPYSARTHWVALEREDALPRAEIKRLIRILMIWWSPSCRRRSKPNSRSTAENVPRI